MHKSLKFPEHYVASIIANDTGTTTRLFDEKGLAVGDTVSFLTKQSGKVFARAEIIKIVEAPFEEAMKNAADLKGLYEQYAGYHGRTIEPSTPVKVISYRIMERMPV